MNDRFQILREVINQRLMHDSNIIIGRPTFSPDRSTSKFGDLPKQRLSSGYGTDMIRWFSISWSQPIHPTNHWRWDLRPPESWGQNWFDGWFQRRHYNCLTPFLKVLVGKTFRELVLLIKISGHR